MTALTRKTNGELVQPFVDRAKVAARQAAEYFMEHPDELAVGLAPLLMLTLATRRHRLNFAEAALISECGFLAGVFAVQSYRQWKDKPAGGPPRLRKVT